MKVTKPHTVLTQPGEQATTTAGRYTLTAQITRDGGHSIHVMLGPNPLPELCFSTPDRATASLAFRTIAEGGENGVSPEGIRQALTDALTRDLHEVQRRRDTPSVNRIGHLNRLLDNLDTPADRAQLADLADTLTRTLADTVPAGSQPQIARSRSNVERLPLTAPQQRIINRHEGGIIRAGNGTAWTTLRSIARMGHADVNARSGQKITAIRLTKQGYAAVVAVAR